MPPTSTYSFFALNISRFVKFYISSDHIIQVSLLTIIIIIIILNMDQQAAAEEEDIDILRIPAITLGFYNMLRDILKLGKDRKYSKERLDLS